MVRIASLNIWFDMKLREARTRALAQLICTLDVDVVCLQEVVPEVGYQLVTLLPGWSCSDPAECSPYGVMTLVPPGNVATFIFHDMPSNMCRRLLTAQLHTLTIGNVHLESLSNHSVRVEQLKLCWQVLAGFQDVVLVGDFNFDSERNFDPPHQPLENDCLTAIMPDYCDLWPVLRNERGYTFDSTLNPYIASPERMRYDRVLVRAPTWRATSIDIFGDHCVAPLVGLTPWEKEVLKRPPTPPRPRPGPRRSLWDEVSSQMGAGHGSGRQGASDRTPSPKATPFLLSDHFGLVATLELAA